MTNLERRISKAEQLLKQKRKPSSKPPKNDVFIIPEDEKRFQACRRNAEKHPHERKWVAVHLPAKKQIR